MKNKRSNEFVETYRSLNENRARLASEEIKKQEAANEATNNFYNNYYALQGMRDRKERNRARLMEGARNDAFATVLKAIYITALEAEALTDDGILLAESMVDNWIAENGGASKILSKVGNDSYLLSRITQIVEDAAEKTVEDIEKEDEPLDDITDDGKADEGTEDSKEVSPEEDSTEDPKDAAVDAVKDIISNASKEELKDVVDDIKKAAEDRKDELKDQKEAEKAAEDADKAQDKADKAEEKAEKAQEKVEKNEAEKQEKEEEKAEEESPTEEEPAEEKDEELKEEEKPEEESEPAEEPEKSEEPAEEEPKEDESEEKSEDEVKSEEESEDKSEEAEEKEEESEEKSKEKESKDEEPASEDPLADDFDDDDDETEEPAESEESEEDIVVDTDEDEDDDDDDDEDFDDDDDDEEVNIDGEEVESDDEDENGRIFDQLSKEDDVKKAINLIRARVADAEQTFIKNNAEDKKKVDELLDKISKNVKTVEDLNDKNKDAEVKAAEESVRYDKRKIDDIRNNRSLTVFEAMTRKFSGSILKNDEVKDHYMTESGVLDTELVVEGAKVMYGFLETINTLQLAPVDSAYIKSIIDNM